MTIVHAIYPERAVPAHLLSRKFLLSKKILRNPKKFREKRVNILLRTCAKES